MNRPSSVLAYCVFMFVCTLGLGCKANEVTWKAQSKSPDGNWIALAHTENVDGPGMGAQWTTVQLKQSFASAKLVDILTIDEGPESVRDLQMTWPSSSHLDITYKGGNKVLFQAVIAIGQTITVEKLTD